MTVVSLTVGALDAEFKSQHCPPGLCHLGCVAYPLRASVSVSVGWGYWQYQSHTVGRMSRVNLFQLREAWHVANAQ